MNPPPKYLWWGAGIGITVVAVAGIAVLIRHRHKKVDLSVFDSPDLPGSGQCMDKDLIRMLQKLEWKTGLPIFSWINSGARSAYWNTKVGGVDNSAHKIPVCKAADIKTPSIAIRNRIIKAAKEVGFTRIGIASTFVHLDNDTSKPQYVAWGYPPGNQPPVNPFG